MSDIRPEHYKNCSLECWDAMKLVLGTDGFISFCLGNPFVYINTTGLQTENPYAPKNKVPWAPSQTDMLAEDWVFVE